MGGARVDGHHSQNAVSELVSSGPWKAPPRATLREGQDGGQFRVTGNKGAPLGFIPRPFSWPCLPVPHMDLRGANTSGEVRVLRQLPSRVTTAAHLPGVPGLGPSLPGEETEVQDRASSGQVIPAHWPFLTALRPRGVREVTQRN